MILELAIFGGTIFASAGGYFLGRKTSPEVTDPDKDFICPYCDNVVTGFKELDLIHHVSCIGKSEADLAAAEKKAAVKKNDEYYCVERHEREINRGSGTGWQYRNYWYHRSTIEIYRNGDHIDTVRAGSAAEAQALANQHIALDMHKRKHKRK